jgi:hypothetical protein
VKSTGSSWWGFWQKQPHLHAQRHFGAIFSCIRLWLATEQELAQGLLAPCQGLLLAVALVVVDFAHPFESIVTLLWLVFDKQKTPQIRRKAMYLAERVGYVALLLPSWVGFALFPQKKLTFVRNNPKTCHWHILGQGCRGMPQAYPFESQIYNQIKKLRINLN